MQCTPQTVKVVLYFLAFGVLALILVLEATAPAPIGMQVIERGDIKYVLDREYEVCHVLYQRSVALMSYRECYNMLVESAEKGMQSE